MMVKPLQQWMFSPQELVKIIGGSQREERLEILDKRMEEWA